jgi:hypothetical protein
MKIRLLPMLFTVFISSALLFGGWYTYHSFMLEKPIVREVSKLDAVSGISLQVKQQTANVQITLKRGTSLQKSYHHISDIIHAKLKNHDVSIEFQDNSNEKLDAWWSLALFDVAQAMDTKNYANIPERLGEMADAQQIDVRTELDNKNLYISLSDGSNQKYIIIARDPEMMEVWNRE